MDGRAKKEVLAKAGASVQDAHRADQVAGIDEEIFEGYIGEKKAHEDDRG